MSTDMLRVGDIAVQVTRKRIKHLHLYVKPPDGRVLVSAPSFVADENIQLFVQENLGWILRKQREMAGQNRLPERRWVSGETVFLWGERYFLTVVKSLSRSYAVRFSGDRVELEVPPLSTTRSREAFMLGWYKEQLRPAAEELLEKWGLETRLIAHDLAIQKMTRCWGTCCPSRAKVRLNVLLARRPKEALSYVVLHELCHLKYRNHGPLFKQMLTRYLPNWREIRKRMNEAPLDCYPEEEE